MTNDLKILKRGEAGYGYLVEYDAGFININDEKNSTILKEITHSKNVDDKETDFNNPLYVYAVLQKYDLENQNGRIYPKEVLMRAVKEYEEKFVQIRASLGELDHTEECVIALRGTAILVDQFQWINKSLVGRVEILATKGFRKYGICSTYADNLADLIFNHNVLVGISSRAVGNVTKINGKNVVEGELNLIGWDAVSTPSTNGSYLLKNMNNVEQFVENKQLPMNPSQKILSEKLNTYLGKSLIM